jgi:hypothetical protein
MPININAEDILKVIKDKTFQKIAGGVVVVMCAFGAGKLSAPQCNQTVICGDIIRDRDALSAQLKKQYAECQEEKTEALEGLRLELDADCADRVDKALGSAQFDENIHCPICEARGICK